MRRSCEIEGQKVLQRALTKENTDFPIFHILQEYARRRFIQSK